MTIILIFWVSIIFSRNTDNDSISSDTLWFVGVGDIMLGTDFPSKNYLPPGNDACALLDDTRLILKEADVTFGNLEGVFLNGGKVAKRCKDTTKCYAFRMPEEYSDCLADAGFDLLSLANNHFGDFGNAAKQRSMELLDSLGIAYAGLYECPDTVVVIKGVKIGFAAFSPNKGTLNISNVTKASTIVEGLENKADMVVVSFHGGAEGADHENVTRKTETFYGENRGNVYEFAHTMIDAGADIVFGHGPHVTRAFEVYKDRFVIYSMGNFCTYARFNLRSPNGFAPIVKIAVNKSGKFISGKIIPVKQTGEGGPIPDPDNRVIKRLNQLLKEDFPEKDTYLNLNGEIILKK